MAKHARQGATPQMNITPLIDVVFQLIIFFMLVNNIIAEQSVQMIVPRLTHSLTHELREGDRVVVNVAPGNYAPANRAADPLTFDGRAHFVRVGQFTFGMDQLDLVTDELRQWKANNPRIEVLLRADAALYYDQVSPVMTAITAADIHTVNLVAYMPENGKTQ